MMPEQLWNYYIKEWVDREKTSILKNDDGSALIYVLVVLVLITVIGLSSNRTTVAELKISGNDKLHKTAFFIADAGISTGRTVLNDLKKADVGNWDKLLAAEDFEWKDINGDPVIVSTLDDALDEVGSRNVGAGIFSLAIRDNDDLDSSTMVDTDNILILTSTVNYQGARVEIEAYVYFDSSDEYAQERYDSASTGKTGDEAAAASSDVRW